MLILRGVWPVLLLTLGGCSSESAAPLVRTVALSHPEDTVSAFEPFVTLDPSRPDRIHVGAQYGPGYNRGGQRIWTWTSQDAGTTWSGGRVIPKAFPPAGQALAADLTMAVGPDGTVYHLSLTADSAPTGLMTAAAALAVSSDGGSSFVPRMVFGTVTTPEPGVMVFTDKSWMVADASPGSPGLGNVYMSWARNRVDFKDTSVTASPVVATSRDGGKTIEEPVSLAPSGFGVTLALRSDGTLDAAWNDLRPGNAEGSRVLHAISVDGGKTFGEPLVVAELADSTDSIELPQVAVGPGDRPFACWTQGPPVPDAAVDVWCAAWSAWSGWGSASRVLSDPTGRTVYTFPAVAAAADAFWLLAYRADSVLSVELYRSADGAHYDHYTTLVTASLNGTPFCPRPGLPCRRSNSAFFPGDYVSLAGAGRRLVAAYTMPRAGGAPGATEITVSVLDVP